MLKKMSGIVLLAIICMLFLAGCNNKKETSKETKSSESSVTKLTSTSSSKNNSSSKTVETTTSSTSSVSSDSIEAAESTNHMETSVSSSESSESPAINQAAPYAVDVTQLSYPVTFNLGGANVPRTIILENNGEMTLDFPASNPTYSNQFAAQADTIPTKEIRISSHDGSGIRTVKVNTQITLTKHLVGNGMHGQSNVMYLINNRNGGLSLITPNYAGNVGPDQMDVMLEAVQ